jgi:hypothetical protein
MWRAILSCCILAAGCARLPAGDLALIRKTAPPRVCLVRGYLDWYSTGIDELAAELRSRGISAEAFREEQWSQVADALRMHPHSPLVLIGFSYGADDVILISRRLDQAHLPVDLLITIDPVTPSNIPPNVKRCINYYEPNGFWDLFPWLRGVPVACDPGVTAENINIRARKDLNEPDTSHAKIAGNPKIHREIESLLMEGRLSSLR